MKLLINSGNFEILAKPTGDVNEIIKTAGMTCYQSAGTTTKTAKEFVEMLRDRGHWSMFDHVSVTVRFKDCSRGMTNELVRHRLAAFAEESTRYVDKSDLHVVGPPHRDCVNDHMQLEQPPLTCLADTAMSFQQMCETVECFYRTLKEHGWSNEDARQILPIGIKSEIVMTADFTEWRHVFALRTQQAAHWEIRRVMGLLLEEFKKLFSPVFDDFELVGTCKNNVNYYKINKPTIKK